MDAGEMQQVLDLAATAIAGCDQEMRAGWIVYLLEALQDHCHDDYNRRQEYEQMLKNVKDDIEARLREGMW